MFDALSANLPQHLRMTTVGSAGASSNSEAVFGLFVSGNYFSVMRVDPVAGNGFVPADDFQTAPPYPAVLSENFWERRFGRDPQILGKTILFSGIPTTIEGITPRDFMGARREVPDVWLPLAARETPEKRAIDSTAYYILTVSVLDPSQLGYSEARAGSLSRELQARLSTRPGITSIASASRIPLGPFVSRTMVSLEGEGPQTLQDQLRAPRYPFSFVSAAYFETLGISMVEGRTFTQDEISNRAPVAVISTALAAKFWPKQDSLGKKIRVGSPAQASFALELPLYLPSVEVVGVSRDIYSDSMTRPDSGAVYLPSRHEGLDSNLLIRTSTDPQTQVEGLTRDLQSIDGNLSPVSSLTAMAAVIATYLPARRATNLDPSSALRSQ